jgi:beta-exotoxin I transport system permease protein
MTIARRLLRDRRRGARWWALGTVFGVATVVALWPSVRGNADVENVVESLPASVRAIIGSHADISLTSAPGYLQARLFSTLLPIVLLIYGIGLGAAAIGGAEEDGTLQLVVTAPVSRTRVAVERLAASLLLLVALAGLGLVTTVVLGAPAGVLDEVSVGRIALATAGVTALALLHAAVAYAAGAVTGRRTTAMAVASSVAVAGYLLNVLAASAEPIRPARALSPWWWFLDRNLLTEQPTFLALGLPVLLSATLAIVAVIAFGRRDLNFP